MVARLLGANGQDETSPFPLDFVVLARQRRDNQDETTPIPLEYRVTELEREPSEAAPPGADPAARGVRVERPRGSRRRPPPKPRRLEASGELRAYAARIAAGEDLPPYRGPVLAGEQHPSTAAAEPPAPREAVAPPLGVAPGPSRAPDAPRPRPLKTIAKMALALGLMAAALAAAAVAGDDAALRAAGSSIAAWFTGNDGSYRQFPVQTAASPCNERADGAPEPVRP